jgi:tRNA(fMet)-specific endonuclease VapC
MSGKISLDTNIIIRLFRNDPFIKKMLSGFSSFCLPVPVIAELLFAARNSVSQKENLKTYNDFIDECSVLNITRETANYYSSIRLSLKQKGRPIPENGIWIASICLQQNMPLATGDVHFDNVEGLKIIKGG